MVQRWNKCVFKRDPPWVNRTYSKTDPYLIGNKSVFPTYVDHILSNQVIISPGTGIIREVSIATPIPTVRGWNQLWSQ